MPGVGVGRGRCVGLGAGNKVGLVNCVVTGRRVVDTSRIRRHRDVSRYEVGNSLQLKIPKSDLSLYGQFALVPAKA